MKKISKSIVHTHIDLDPYNSFHSFFTITTILLEIQNNYLRGHALK